jgi:signal transduction histidine kinase/ActR/RegA family two-component response regulator
VLSFDDAPWRTAVVAIVVAGWAVACVFVGRLFHDSQMDRTRRIAAERASAQSRRIAQLSSALAQARTPRAAIEAAVQEPLHALKADAGIMWLVSRDAAVAELARAVAYTHEIPQRVELSEKGPLSDAVGRGAPLFIESRAAKAAEYPAQPIDPSGGRFETSIVLPILIGSRVVAIAQYDFESSRDITADDREYLRVLGTYAGQGLDRTWQLEFAERARVDAEKLREQADRELVSRTAVEQALRASETRYRALAARTSRLHALSAALSEAVTTDAVARAVVQHGSIVVGATGGEVMVLANDGAEFETLYREPASTTGTYPRTEVEDGWCATDAVRQMQPIFIDSLHELQERFWRSASAAADDGFESSATIPLLIDGSPIGVVAFHFTVPVKFDQDYQTLLASVAHHCAQTLDRARLYESTQHARTDAERANRLKDEFVSIVSHELRTPLNAILGWTTMLQRQSLSVEKSARALQSIFDNATRQARLIDELLDFSRVAAGRTNFQMENVDVRELIRGVVDSMTPTAAARGIELRLSAVPPVEVVGDIRRLEQVFFNLVDNALKFTAKGGQVSLDVRIIDGHVEVTVRDSGIGIEPEFLPHVFDRFRQGDSTTSRAYGGLGLGLSIAKQLVQAHKGTIAAESGGENRGATFTVRLPVGAPRSTGISGTMLPPSPPAPPEEEAPRLEGIHVLVVDDEPDARQLMAHTLELSGARVTVAKNTHDALDVLERAAMDVLVADLAMPGDDGFALIRKVRASAAPSVASIPAAAVTAFTRDDYRQDAFAAGFQHYLGKPFRPDDLVRTVNQLANRVTH